MKNVIETSSGGYALTVEISDPLYGQNNLVITKTKNPDFDAQVIAAISFELDAEAARALSFSFGELAKTLGRRK